jgi:hypothetical protein
MFSTSNSAKANPHFDLQNSLQNTLLFFPCIVPWHTFPQCTGGTFLHLRLAVKPSGRCRLSPPVTWDLTNLQLRLQCFTDTFCSHRTHLCDLQVEISLQPWLAFKPDGVILFSDILTPLTGMNIPFDITAGKGPIIAEPIRTMEVRCCCVCKTS